MYQWKKLFSSAREVFQVQTDAVSQELTSISWITIKTTKRCSLSKDALLKSRFYTDFIPWFNPLA